MEKIIAYIECITGEKNLSTKSWQQIVDTVILPKMAGSKDTRCYINDRFMNLLACFSYEISVKDLTLAPVLFEIGLQRLSCGAVVHDEISWQGPLPIEYMSYSSCWDFNHVMTKGCYNFIMDGLEQSLKFGMTKNHALKILFGLMEKITPTGEVDCNYSLDDFNDKAPQLFKQAEKLVEHYASFEEIYPYYTRVGQWEKHMTYLGKNKDKINWKDFFERTQAVAKKNFISAKLLKNLSAKKLKMPLQCKNNILKKKL